MCVNVIYVKQLSTFFTDVVESEIGFMFTSNTVKTYALLVLQAAFIGCASSSHAVVLCILCHFVFFVN